MEGWCSTSTKAWDSSYNPCRALSDHPRCQLAHVRMYMIWRFSGGERDSFSRPFPTHWPQRSFAWNDADNQTRCPGEGRGLGTTLSQPSPHVLFLSHDEMDNWRRLLAWKRWLRKQVGSIIHGGGCLTPNWGAGSDTSRMDLGPFLTFYWEREAQWLVMHRGWTSYSPFGWSTAKHCPGMKRLRISRDQ